MDKAFLPVVPVFLTGFTDETGVLLSSSHNCLAVFLLPEVNEEDGLVLFFLVTVTSVADTMRKDTLSGGCSG